MKQVTTEGKELRYWDFNAPVLDSEGKATVKPVFDKEGKPVIATVKQDDGTESGVPVTLPVLGNWVKKPTQTSYTALESVDEVIEAVQADEKAFLETLNAGYEAIASAKSGVPPEGTFSKAMASAAAKALKAAPQFRGLKGNALKLAIMRYISENEGVKVGFLAAFDSLRTAPDADDEEE